MVISPASAISITGLSPQFDGSLGLYGAKMNPFHSLDIKWDMGIFLGDGKAAARIIYLGKFYDFYFLHIY